MAAREAHAQDSTRVVTLVGEVRDASTEFPIRNASVEIVELGETRLTDGNGFFRFEGIPAGTWTFATSALGYRENREASTIASGNLLLVRLEPDPLELTGLYVDVYSRLEERRRRFPIRVFSWEREELEAIVSPTVGQMIKMSGVAQFVPCGGEFSDLDLPNCVLRGGGRQRVQVFVDDIPVLAAEGAGRLWAYDPRDLWSVEFVPSCAAVRIYTVWYMEAVQEDACG